MNQIPQMVPIEQLVECLIDYRGKTPPKTDSGVRLITAKVIKQGQIRAEPAEYISADFYGEWMRRGLPRDFDVLITTEAPLGEVALLRLSEPVALAQRVILLRANQALVDPRFLFYSLQSDEARAGLHARATGTTVSGIKQSELRRVQLPLFKLPIQRRIASILSAYDDLIENCERRIRVLDEMARALYREWFVNFRYPRHEKVHFVESPIGRIPRGWKVMAASEAMSINPKVSLPREGARPFVPMTSLTNDTMLIRDIECRPATSGAKFQNGDTLFARITPCLENGKTAYVQFLADDSHAACGSTEFIVLRGHVIPGQFVYCLARSDEFRAHAIKSMTGATGRQRVQEACFNQYFLPIAPDSLLKEFAERTGPSFKLTQALHQRIENLRKTRDLLLPRLLSGQLSVAEAA